MERGGSARWEHQGLAWLRMKHRRPLESGICLELERGSGRFLTLEIWRGSSSSPANAKPSSDHVPPRCQPALAWRGQHRQRPGLLLTHGPSRGDQGWGTAAMARTGRSRCQAGTSTVSTTSAGIILQQKRPLSRAGSVLLLVEGAGGCFGEPQGGMHAGCPPLRPTGSPGLTAPVGL